MLNRPKPKPAKQIDYTPRPRDFVLRRSDGKDRAHVSVPKRNFERDKDYLRKVAGLPCIQCGAVGFSQAAHPNHGKGLALKTSDLDAFPLCHVGANNCHGHWDAYAFGRDMQRALEPIYAKRTREALRHFVECARCDGSGIVSIEIEGDLIKYQCQGCCKSEKHSPRLIDMLHGNEELPE